MTTDVVRVLDRVIELLSDAKSWRQGGYAGIRFASRNDAWTVVSETTIYDPEANCFCLGGAIDKACGVHSSQLGLRVREEIRRCAGIKEAISTWNDWSWRTHEDVLSAVVGTRDRLSQGAPS